MFILIRYNQIIEWNIFLTGNIFFFRWTLNSIRQWKSRHWNFNPSCSQHLGSMHAKFVEQFHQTSSYHSRRIHLRSEWILVTAGKFYLLQKMFMKLFYRKVNPDSWSQYRIEDNLSQSIDFFRYRKQGFLSKKGDLEGLCRSQHDGYSWNHVWKLS